MVKDNKGRSERCVESGALFYTQGVGNETPWPARLLQPRPALASVHGSLYLIISCGTPRPMPWKVSGQRVAEGALHYSWQSQTAACSKWEGFQRIIFLRHIIGINREGNSGFVTRGRDMMYCFACLDWACSWEHFHQDPNWEGLGGGGAL